MSFAHWAKVFCLFVCFLILFCLGIHIWYELNYVSPNSFVEVLTSNVTFSGDLASKKIVKVK